MRSEKSTDVSQKQIELNNPESSIDVSISNTSEVSGNNRNGKNIVQMDGKGESCSEIDTKVETDTEKKEGAGTEVAQTGESNAIELEKSGSSQDTKKKEGAGTEVAQTDQSNGLDVEKKWFEPEL